MATDSKTPSFPPETARLLNDQLDALARLHSTIGTELSKPGFDATSELSFITDKEGKVLHANPPLRTMLGDADEYLLDWFETRPDNDQIQKLGASGIVWIPSSSGPSTAGYVVIRPCGGVLVGVIKVCQIQTLAQIELKRQQSEQALALIELSSDGLAVIDESGSIEFLNLAFARQKGHESVSELIGTSWSELLDADDLKRFEGEILTSMEFTGDWSGVFEDQDATFIRRPDGSLLVRFKKLGEEQSSSDAFKEAKLETEQLYAKLDEAISKANQAALEAELANQAKSAFLASMSHEIRTPMNAIIGLTGVLLDTQIDDEQSDYLQTMKASGDALLVLINDILDFSKIESDKMELEQRPVDPRCCVEEALELLVEKASSKGLELCYETEGDVPYGINGDVTRLRQILVNLIGNAIKFTDEGQVEVIVKTKENNGKVCVLEFVVRDSGIGIPADKQDRLFKSFSQVDSSTTRKYGGTGLGLAISKKLTELMGGEMRVESEEGKGSSFIFTILSEITGPVVYSPDFDNQGQSLLAGKSLLVIQPNAVIAEKLERQLARWKAHVAIASSTEAGLQLVSEQEFDIAIIDQNLGAQDMDRVLESMRQSNNSKVPYLVRATHFGKAAETNKTSRAVTKPIKPSNLLDVLAKTLQSSKRVRKRPLSSGEPSKQKLGDTHPLRILMAEDNKVNQKVGALILKKLSYTIDVANNGLEVLEILEKNDYDVVLMDIQMPEMDGYQATREISKRFPTERRPYIIALTANAMQGDRERAIAAGMNDYVSKPIRNESIGAALEKAYRLTAGTPPDEVVENN